MIINEGDRQFFWAWFRSYAETFYSLPPEGRSNIAVKEEHTFRVCENMAVIAGSMSLGRGEALVANAVALFHDVGRFPLQIEQIELDRRLGNRAEEVRGLGNLGSAYTVLGLYKQARLVLEQARAINEALGARRTLAYNLMSLGQISMETGDLRTAGQLLEKALHEISPSQDYRGTIYILDMYGRVLIALDDWHAAARRFTEAYELALSLKLTALAYESAVGLAACLVMLGQPEEARRYASEVWEHLRKHGWLGMLYPEAVYHLCAETFDALGETGSPVQ